ncbi:hypothetical protein [Pseudomonas palleroniana]|uniref:hypothetical protein n=1 Tax=Pseudomonas palleroniana TaxID=191390 RepID=UPI001FD15B16|nr:hypothetical protein [Pseudomonas palleroniana]UOP12113.1 hypothetical protein LDL65_06055 [Pseudomonas palleroniana]
MKSDPQKKSNNDSFYSDILKEDELGATIRAHIYIESALEKLIETLTSDYAHVKKMQLDFSQKVNLAVAIGMPKDLAPALLALGKIRNKFAHRLDTKIDEELTNNLYKQFSPEQRNTIHASFKNTLKKTSDQRINFSDLNPREKFAILSVALIMQIFTLTNIYSE